METFRSPFPASVPQQQCPVCLAPHFPFCPPQHHAPTVHPPQRYESFYPGQPASHMHHGAIHPQLAAPFGRAPHAGPDSHFRGARTSELSSNQSYFPQGHPPHPVHEKSDRPFFGQLPTQFSQLDERNRHISNGSVYVDTRQGCPNSWIEAERDFAHQQQRRRAEIGERSESGVAQGRNQYEPLTDAFGDRIHGNNLPGHLNAARGSYDGHGGQGFVPNGRRLCTSAVYNALGDDQTNMHLIGLPRREEVCNPCMQHGGTREDDLIHRQGFQAETYDKREGMQMQDSGDYAPSQKNLKRKHGQQPLSREEELLIEKGLLDDDSSEPPLHESSRHQSLHGNEMSNCKQGGLEEDQCYYQQPGYQSSIAYTEREGLGTGFGESGEQNFQKRRFFMSEGQRNKKREVEVERGVPMFSGIRQPESLNARPAPWDVPMDVRKPSQIVEQCPHLEGVPTNKEILYRQYQEWEAEEKHLEALKRAERLAREIQQREECVYRQESGLQSDQVHKPELLQENRVQTYHQHLENIRPDISQTNISQHHGISMQHPSYQHPKFYSDRESHFQEVHHQNQQHTRDGFGQDVQVLESLGGPQSRQQDASLQFLAMSSQRLPWRKEQMPHQPHLATSQPVPHHDQQLAPLRAMQSIYPGPAAQEFSHGRSDRVSSVSLLGTAHEMPASFPPLPNTTSNYPPPPDSPPPPLPSTQLPLNEAPLPPLPAATFPSARPISSQGLHEHPQQSRTSEGQRFQEPHHLAHMGVSQTHTRSHFEPQPPQPLEKSKIVNAVNIFRNPGRLTRPDRFVVILRGLPGSGKSYLAKALRDVEVMNCGNAPRIHSMDDYFTCEVEKEEIVETGSSKIKKKVVKQVMEYCYEPEMEEVYRASMLKAFRKTLEEGMFKFVIVDDRNVLIADFAQFWAIAKRSGYEAFILEAPYSDVKGCAARNVHSFTEQQIQSMAGRWEATPSLYLKMDVSSLFRADDLNAQDIIEVDMDADDMERDLEDEEEENNGATLDHFLSLASEKPVTGDRWGDNGDHEKEAATLEKLERSSLDIVDTSRERRKSSDNALSGLMSTYGKKDKFVHWSDNQFVKGSSTGFSIGAKTTSLVIGPGPGYNGRSNLPIVADDSGVEHHEVKKSRKFVEQLRAEQEAFKAVFVRRRQRIRGMDDEDDD